MPAIDPLLATTPLLDFQTNAITALIAQKGWRALPRDAQIGAVYTFVRDEIAFGYNAKDAIPASRVLREGRGQCNTKSILLMALLRALGHRAGLRGLAIHKSLQRGIVPEWAYRLAGREVLHSWVEVETRWGWRVLEGVIMDRPMLDTLQSAFGARTDLCAYGVGTSCLPDPKVDWRGSDTFIQSTGVIRDFGLYEAPDDFYADHSQNRGVTKEMLFRHVVRHQMNRRVAKIRAGVVMPIPGGPDAPPLGRVFQNEGQSNVA